MRRLIPLALAACLLAGCSDDEPVANCVPAPPHVVEYLTENMKLGAEIGDVEMVSSRETESLWFSAARLTRDGEDLGIALWETSFGERVVFAQAISEPAMEFSDTGNDPFPESVEAVSDAAVRCARGLA